MSRFHWQSSPTLVNCTIVGNSASGIETSLNARPLLRNCILWGNQGGSIRSTANVDVRYCCLDGGTALGETNLDFDPHLMRSLEDFRRASTSDVSLAPDSPCIDRGHNEYIDVSRDLRLDANGNPRIVNGRVDIGAFEHIQK